MLSRFEHKNIIKVLVAVNILLVLITAYIWFLQSERVKRLYSQQAAERWESKENPYSEISLFYSDSYEAGKKTVEELRTGITKKLVEDTYFDPADTSGRRAYIDAYSGFADMVIERENVQLTGKVYGVSDDFFLVHPIPLLNGNYINPVEKASEIGDGIDPFQVVLDENMAWNIFGSVNVEGMKIWIGGRVFTVMGVVEASQNKTEEMAYGNYDAAFIPYSAFALMDKKVNINCYEAVLPEPIKGYAMSTMGKAADIVVDPEEEASGTEVRSSLSFGKRELVENTDRFGISSIWKYLKNKKYMSMKTTEIAYPFWENVARFEMERAGGIFKLCCILLILPVVSVLVLLGWLYSKRTVVFNAKNKEKALDLLAELGAGIKDHFTKPKVENYDDDPEDDEDDEEDGAVESASDAGSSYAYNTYAGNPGVQNPEGVNPVRDNPDEADSGKKKKKAKKNKKEKKPSAEEQIKARVAEREAAEAAAREAEEAAQREAEEAARQAAQQAAEEAARQAAQQAAEEAAQQAAQQAAEEAARQAAQQVVEEAELSASEAMDVENAAEPLAAPVEENEEDFELTTINTVVEEPENESGDSDDSEDI